MHNKAPHSTPAHCAAAARRRRYGPLLLVALLLAVLTPAAGAQEEDDEAEEPSSGWEFVPGAAADFAAGLIDPSELEASGLDPSELVPSPAGALEAGFDPRGLFIDHIDVRLLPLVFRILDPWARPIPDLGPDDLEASIGEASVPVAAVDWYGSYETPEVAAAWSERDDAQADWHDPSDWHDPVDGAAAGLAPDGARHLVIFMQIGEHDHVGLDRGLIWGHLKSLPGLERLLRSLGPSDRVALISHGAHMELWHDFTSDHRAVHDLLFDTVGYGEPETRPRAGGGPSLARAFEHYGIRDITNTAEAMRVLAEALAEIPGIKDVLYIGWSFAGPKGELKSAITTLSDHQSVVSVLVSKQSDSWRGGTLEALATYTGGIIEGTLRFPGRSVDRMIRSLSGHYVVSLDLSGRDDLEGELVLRVKGREAKIVSRPYVF